MADDHPMSFRLSGSARDRLDELVDLIQQRFGADVPISRTFALRIALEHGVKAERAVLERLEALSGDAAGTKPAPRGQLRTPPGR